MVTYTFPLPTHRVGTKSEPILGGILDSTGTTWDSNTKY